MLQLQRNVSTSVHEREVNLNECTFQGTPERKRAWYGKEQKCNYVNDVFSFFTPTYSENVLKTMVMRYNMV